MEKRYADAAIFYAAAAMVFGVFYREFTKFNGFTGKTNLSVMHTHYFLLGMFFFLILMLLEKNFRFSGGEPAFSICRMGRQLFRNEELDNMEEMK